jgi:tetratricopeptide (TPR) repeat protein
MAGRGAAVLAVVLLAGAAPAAAGPREDAAARLDRGVIAYRAAHYQEALGLFQDAYALFPSHKILFNIGRTLESLGRWPQAAQAYDLFLTEVGGDAGERTVAARAALDRLALSLGRLQFHGDLTRAALTIDGAPLYLPAHRRVYVTAGRHVISAAAPGLVTRRIRVEVAAGAEQPVALQLVPPPQPAWARGPAPTTSTPGPGQGHGGSRRMWTWIAAGLSVAAAGGGVYAGMRADRAYQDYQQASTLEDWQAARERVQRDGRIANALFAGAGAAAVAGCVLFFVEGRHAEIAVSASREGGMQAWIAGSL